MAILVKHNFVSPVADAGNPNEVGPDEWNDNHSMTMATGNLLGRTSAGAGVVEELPISSVVPQIATTAEAQAGTNNTKMMTPLRAYEGARVLVEHINIREPRFAGGAKMNGIDDDAPAFRAAVAYAQTLGALYDGGAVKIKVPRGIVRLDSADATKTYCQIDISNANNILLEGEGDGATTVRGSQNLRMFNAERTSASPLYRFGMRDMTLEGVGSTFANNHLIWLGAANNCYLQNLRLWKARTGIVHYTCFHTEFINLRMNGQGGLALYDGIYSADGEIAVIENSVGIFGGRIQGCTRYGWRGECVTGSSVFGLEVLGCENTGVYFGDSPGNKPLQWFTWVGGLIDTCPNLLSVKKGSSTIAELLHFSGMWMGYASGNPGTAVEFVGINRSCFVADIIANCVYAANIQNCTFFNFGARVIQDYDRLNTGSVAIICNSTTDSRFDIGAARKLAGSSSATAFVEQNTANRNLITGIFTGAVTTVGANSNKTLCLNV